jgi:uncharacterized protein (DUF1778 family)
MSAATARIEARVAPETKARIEHAAALEHATVSEFVVSAANARAEQVMRRHESYTTVPADYFDQLLAALDETAVSNRALENAFRRSRARGAKF